MASHRAAPGAVFGPGRGLDDPPPVGTVPDIPVRHLHDRIPCMARFRRRMRRVACRGTHQARLGRSQARPKNGPELTRKMSLPDRSVFGAGQEAPPPVFARTGTHAGSVGSRKVRFGVARSTCTDDARERHAARSKDARIRKNRPRTLRHPAGRIRVWKRTILCALPISVQVRRPWPAVRALSVRSSVPRGSRHHQTPIVNLDSGGTVSGQVRTTSSKHPPPRRTLDTSVL